MTDKKDGLIDRLARNVRTSYDLDRKQNPHRFINKRDGVGPNFLYVENVARMLGCNVDFVRRIPRSELPASQPAQRLIYQRSDVEAYIRSKRDNGTQRHVASRKPTGARTGASAERTPPDETYDAVSHTRALLHRKPE